MYHSPFFSFNFVHLQDASLGLNFGFVKDIAPVVQRGNIYY